MRALALTSSGRRSPGRAIDISGEGVSTASSTMRSLPTIAFSVMVSEVCSLTSSIVGRAMARMFSVLRTRPPRRASFSDRQ